VLFYFAVVTVRNFALFLIGAMALGVPLASAKGAQQATGGPVVLEGKCATADQSAACTSCAVALAPDLKQPAGDRTLIGSCPNMAAGRYSLRIAVPIELVPAQAAPRIFGQLQESFGATSRDQDGRGRDVLAETPAVTWSWFGPGSVMIYQTTPVTIDRDAGVDITFKLRNLRYFIPHRTQGRAHDDGELIVGKAELISLERLPAPGSAGTVDPGAPREFSTETLAAVVPGSTTEKQVEALLGQPWRTDAGDEDEAIPESWDYRGKDADGTYLVHIEFDAQGTTSVIVKVPDKTHTATPIVAKAPAGPTKP
jgi:hypothetical protein